jgi:hypothetical protein
VSSLAEILEADEEFVALEALVAVEALFGSAAFCAQAEILKTSMAIKNVMAFMVTTPLFTILLIATQAVNTLPRGIFSTIN